MRKILFCSLLMLLITVSGSAKSVRHYVFFGLDREKLKDAAAFLELKGFDGAQVTYSWRQLEPGKDEYDFSLDPVPVMARAKTPSLWLLGGRDLSIPAERSRQTLEKLREQGMPITVKVYPDGDHGLHDVSTGRRLPYVEDMIEWLKRQGILRE